MFDRFNRCVAGVAHVRVHTAEAGQSTPAAHASAERFVVSKAGPGPRGNPGMADSNSDTDVYLALAETIIIESVLESISTVRNRFDGGPHNSLRVILQGSSVMHHVGSAIFCNQLAQAPFADTIGGDLGG